MSKWYILDKDDNPVETDTITAGRWFENSVNDKQRVVAWTDVAPGVSLSTVFLALNHSWIPGKVLLYESLWFGGEFDGEMRRYSTKAEALAGHNEMLAEYNNKEIADVMAEVAKEIVDRNL